MTAAVQPKVINIKPTQEDIEQAKTTFGVVYPCRVQLEGHYDVEFVIHRLSRAQYHRFIETSGGKNGKARAMATAFNDGVAFPKGEQVESLLEQYPAVADVVTGKILELSGVAEAELGKAY